MHTYGTREGTPAKSVWGFDYNFTNYSFKTNLDFQTQLELPPLAGYF